MAYDYSAKKIIALVRKDLPSWQAMNAMGHMALSLGAKKDDALMGRATLTDASGISHSGIARFGFIIKEADGAGIARVVRDARADKDILLVDFPREMLDTRHDDDLVESMRKKGESDFEYLGALLYGTSEKLDTMTASCALWK